MAKTCKAAEHNTGEPVSSRQPTAITVWLIACCFSGLVAPAVADAPSDGYVLLHNGNVVRGNLVNLGGTALIQRADGSQLRLPTRDVRLAAASLHELYRRRTANRADDDLAGLIQDARWCYRHGLWQAMHEALEKLETQHGRHPTIQRLRLQWRQAIDAAGAAPDDTPTSPQPGPSDPLPPAAESLEHLDIPAHALGHFSRQIQPLLIRRCANAGCHRAPNDRTQWQLSHRGAHVIQPGRMTRLNLAATLELLDRQTPSASELLSYATKPHGDVAEPPLPSRGDAALEVFQQWAESVSRWGQQDIGELAAVSNWPLEAIAMGAMQNIIVKIILIIP